MSDVSDTNKELSPPFWDVRKEGARACVLLKKMGCYCRKLKKQEIKEMQDIGKVKANKKDYFENKARLISIKKAANRCGISRSTFYELISSGKTPLPIKLGKRVLFDIQELDEWIENKCPPRSKWDIMRNAT
jgi:excisionase family DNA binding protein